MKKVFNVIDTLITLTICVIALSMVVPLLFNIRTYVVMSSSMVPTFSPGAICYIDKNQRDPEIGDIIAYRLSDELVTHRVVAIDEDGNYITQGDNNETEDLAPVTPEQVVGKNVFWVPYFGYFVVWIQTAPGIIICLTVVIAYAILSRLIMRRNERWN